jgi:hypothetical protein
MKTDAMSFRRSRTALLFLAAFLPIAGCHDEGPTAAREVTPLPFVTPTPTFPLAAVEVALVPSSSFQQMHHAFTIHIAVRETRGVAISAVYRGVVSGTNYNFPAGETSPEPVSIASFASGIFDIHVEHDEDISCGTGLLVRLEIDAADGFTQRIETSFNCTTGYWPLG